MGDLDRLVILVTGGSRGIGAAVSQVCSSQGARIFIAYLNDDKAAESTVGTIHARGGKAVAMKCDVREEDHVVRVVDACIEAYGRLDAVVNNAHARFEPTAFPKLCWPQIEEQIVGSLKSAFTICRHALPHLYLSENPSVLNMSSVTVGQAEGGFAHRDIAKAALEQLTRSMAIDLAPRGIRVNALSVGWTQTEQLQSLDSIHLERKATSIPLRRFARPQEIAQSAAFLISRRSSYITGVVFPVSGGIDGYPR